MNSEFNDMHKANCSLIEVGPLKVVRVSQLLPKHERESLYDAVCHEQEAFKTLNFPGSIDGMTKYLKFESNGEVGTNAILTHKAYKVLCNRIIDQLPALFEMLDIEPFDISNVPLTFNNSSHGHFGNPHVDSVNGQYQISLLYYFHGLPKKFRGGDLEFYSHDDGSPKGYSHDPIIKIDFEDNLLIAFVSETFHGVTEVLSDSDEFGDGRFVAVGFLGSE